MNPSEPHLCFICDQPFAEGELTIIDITEGLCHRACCGEDRASYVDLETGEPIGPDEPIPADEPYRAEDWI